MQNSNEFKYTYSAKEQDELKKIREKYIAKEEDDKMQRLRRLDGSVTKKASIYSIIVGTVGALILGFGMSLIMSELGNAFGAAATPVGIIVGILGAAEAAAAYPLYNVILKSERKKIASEVIRLTDELIK